MFMVPEIDSRPRIFMATSFPLIWTEKVSGIIYTRLIDPTIFEFNGSWWLQGMYRRGESLNEFAIFESTSPTISSWESIRKYQKEYISNSGNSRTKSFIFNSQFPVGVRAAGTVFTYNGELYRVTQNSNFGNYGSSVDLYKIRNLSIFASQYSQEIVPAFKKHLRSPENIGSWNKHRFHHADVKSFRDAKKQFMFAIAIDGHNQATDALKS